MQDPFPMKVLIASQQVETRVKLESAVSSWGYGVVSAQDGAQACAILDAPNPPRIAILEVFLPKVTGIEVCRRVRIQRRDAPYIYLLLLISKDTNLELTVEAGVNDCILTPFDEHELRVRLRAGQRIVALLTGLTHAKAGYRHGSNLGPRMTPPSLVSRWTVIQKPSHEIDR